MFDKITYLPENGTLTQIVINRILTTLILSLNNWNFYYLIIFLRFDFSYLGLVRHLIKFYRFFSPLPPQFYINFFYLMQYFFRKWFFFFENSKIIELALKKVNINLKGGVKKIWKTQINISFLVFVPPCLLLPYDLKMYFSLI